MVLLDALPVPTATWDTFGVQASLLGILAATLGFLFKYYLPQRDVKIDAQRKEDLTSFQTSIKGLTDGHEKVVGGLLSEFASARQSFEVTMEKYRAEKQEQLGVAQLLLSKKEQQLVDLLQQRIAGLEKESTGATQPR